jgi:hypothetical protein
MRRIALSVLLALGLVPCWASAQVVVPAEAEPYTLVTAKLEQALPEGGYVDGGWEIDGADMKSLGSEVVFTGKPGTYTVEYDGVILKDVTFTDGAGQSITIKSYLGRIKAKGTCKIKGETPGPDPPDPPQPGGKKQIVLWLTEGQLDNLPQAQRDILTSLVFRDWLKSQGHVLLEVHDPANFSAGSVPAKWKAWVDSVSGKELPAISLAPKDGGPVVTHALPANVEATKALITGQEARR